MAIYQHIRTLVEVQCCSGHQEQSLCSEPTSVESFAVGEEGELKEKGAQKVRSTNNAGHLETEWERGERKKKMGRRDS